MSIETEGSQTTDTNIAPAADDAPLMDQGVTDAQDGEGDKPNDDQQQDGDKPAEGDQPNEGDGEQDGEKPEEGEKPEGAPEAYEDFSVPEGVTLNTDAAESFKELAKANNLSQADAQKYVDLATSMAQQQRDAIVQEIIDTRKQWRDASVNDEEFGGAALKENMGKAVKAREQFGTPELKKLLDESGLGDHPEVIRFFYRVGNAVSEHALVIGDTSKTNKPFYDHPTSGR